MSEDDVLQKLRDLFRERINEAIMASSPFGSANAVRDYVKRLEPSVLGCGLDGLLDIINKDDRQFYVVRNPYNNALFLAVERGFARKAVVLGLP